MSNTIEAGNNIAVGLTQNTGDTCSNTGNATLGSVYQYHHPCPTCGRCPTCGQYRYPPGTVYYPSYTGYSWGGGIQSGPCQNAQTIN